MTRVCMDTRILWILERSTPCRQAKEKEKGSSGPRDGCFKCGGAHFQRDCICKQEHRQANVWAMANRASHGPRVNLQSQAKERVQKTKKNPKDIPRDPKVPKAHARVKTSKTGISGLENLKTDKLGNLGIRANEKCLYH